MIIRYSTDNQYEPLLDEDNDNIRGLKVKAEEGIISNIMNNPFGFGDTRLLQFVNVNDNSVIELVGNRLIARPSDPTKQEFQTFQSNLTESGYYEVRSMYQSDVTVPLVWDYISHSKLLIQKKQKRAAKRSNQNWIAEVLPGGVAAYYIISAPDCVLCVKSMGIDEQIKLVKKDEFAGDKSAHWKLVRIDPVQHGSSQESTTKISTATAGASKNVDKSCALL